MPCASAHASTAMRTGWRTLRLSTANWRPPTGSRSRCSSWARQQATRTHSKRRARSSKAWGRCRGWLARRRPAGLRPSRRSTAPERAPRQARRFGGPASAAVSRIALPRFAALAYGDTGDDQPGDRVGPPPTEQRIRCEADEQRDRKVGAQHVLAALGFDRARSELLTDATLGARQQWHGRRGYEREADSDPAGVRVGSAEGTC